MIVQIEMPDNLGPDKLSPLSVSDRAQLMEAYKKGAVMHGHCHPVNVPGDLPNDVDPEVKAFYAEDQKVLDSIPKTAFTPIKPYTYERAPAWPPIEWYWFFYRLWHSNLKYWPWQLRDGVVNMYNWFTMIWNLRDWDNFHLYAIMLKQLQAMRVGCRANSAEAPHHAALDRCTAIMDELIKRGQCECDVIHGISFEERKEKTQERWVICRKCEEEQRAMLEEFGKLFAAFSRNWWD
jgi:hypothetical protein